MGAPVRGVVLNQATETPRPRGAGKYYTRRPTASRPEQATAPDADAGVATESQNGDHAPTEDAESGSERQEIPQR
jgi:hypothetical protein